MLMLHLSGRKNFFFKSYKPRCQTIIYPDKVHHPQKARGRQTLLQLFSTHRVLPGIFLAQPIMCTSSLSASLVRDIIMEASVKGMLGRLTSTWGGSASRRVSTSCSGLRALSRSSFTRGTGPLLFLDLLRQCSCSVEVLCLLTAVRYPHLSLREPKGKIR